jgi:CRISPR-associated endonuclease Cas3-HD
VEYYAHSPRGDYPAQLYETHILDVTRRALRYAEEISSYNKQDGEALKSLAETAAHWHDLGKLDEDNQAVLSGKKAAKRLPKKHWDAGSAFLNEHNPFAAAAVYSHHTGYDDFSAENVREGHAFRVEEQIQETNQLLDGFISIHKIILRNDDNDIDGILPYGNKSIFLRLLLSCLSDADHTDTARHYGNISADVQPSELRPAERLSKLNEYVAKLSENTDKDTRTNLRGEMYEHCRDANIADSIRISSCDSPVGSGKTTAVMAHLLAQAEKRGLRRIFVVLPFTNIICQSVNIYRNALTLPGENPEDAVAEIHHRADFESEEARYFSALWRTPIVVTTAVAFFETLAANSPSALRRLHELPGSAVFVDEAHAALPAKLLPVAWKWMRTYANEWGCYWVLSSGSLCKFWQIPLIAQKSDVIDVPEIVDAELCNRLNIYENNRIRYQYDKTPKTIDSLIEWIHSYSGPRLVILNTVNNAAVVASAYKERFGREKVEHLSTALTPFDRDVTLDKIKERLQNTDDTDWTLIATSCVEAGADFSFRAGFRELGSLSSLLQTSGRINREGKHKDTEIWTFVLSKTPETNENPSVKDAALILHRYFTSNTEITHDLCTKAISDEIKLRGVSDIYNEIINSENDLAFSTVEKKFKVINEETRLVIVSKDIAERIKYGKLNWRELQKNSVQMRSSKLRQIPEITEGIFYWDLGYDSFLGYMKGLLFHKNPGNYMTLR